MEMICPAWMKDKYEWYEKHHVRKYGAHGTSHRYIAKKLAEELGRDDLKHLIIKWIGGGHIWWIMRSSNSFASGRHKEDDFRH